MALHKTDSRWACEVADWIEKELAQARRGEKEMDLRVFVQNTDLIVEALRKLGSDV